MLYKAYVSGEIEFFGEEDDIFYRGDRIFKIGDIIFRASVTLRFDELLVCDGDYVERDEPILEVMGE